MEMYTQSNFFLLFFQFGRNKNKLNEYNQNNSKKITEKENKNRFMCSMIEIVRAQARQESVQFGF